MDYSNQDLQGLDFSGRNLEGVTFQDTDTDIDLETVGESEDEELSIFDSLLDRLNNNLPSEAEQLAMIEGEDIGMEERISQKAKTEIYDPLNPPKLSRKEYDESNVTTCFDFVMQDEMTEADIVRDNLIVFIDEYGNPFCVSVEDFEKQVSDSANWAQECVHRNATGPIYVRTIISAGAGTGYIPLEQVKAALKRGRKIIHITKDKTFNKSWGYNASRGGSWVSAYHCQEGSNIDTYSYSKCSGPKCKGMIEAADNIQAVEDELTDEQIMEQMRAAARERAAMTEDQIRQQAREQAEAAGMDVTVPEYEGDMDLDIEEPTTDNSLEFILQRVQELNPQDMERLLQQINLMQGRY